MAPQSVQNWLATQCRMIGGTAHGMVLLGQPDQGPYLPVASWPENTSENPPLRQVANAAIEQRHGIVASIDRVAGGRGPANDAVAAPVLVDGRLHGAVVIELRGDRTPEQQAALHMLQWGSTWLEHMVRQEAGEADADGVPAAKVLELAGHSLAPGDFQGVATAFATRLAGQLDCTRVSIGFVSEGVTSVTALSHSAVFESRQNMIRSIGRAMDEAVGQERVITFPAADENLPHVDDQHRQLCTDNALASVCSVPFCHAGGVVGVITFERDEGKPPFDAYFSRLAERVTALAGPVLELRRRDERPLPGRLREAAGALAGRYAGRGDLTLKAGTLLTALLLLFLLLGTGQHRVTADATLEGMVERVVVTTQDGYIQSAPARPGDRVNEGDVLALLDDRDLELEHVKWVSQRDQLAKEYREALADMDRVSVRVLGARLEQAKAQIQLLQEQIARARITAPFDGIVIEGDLSRSLGAPVEKGETLFRIAPLDSYRVVLLVDERDVRAVREGGTGRLALASLPGRRLPITIDRVTPVAGTEGGLNYFRVEASLDENDETVRPGMQGVARVDAGRRNIAWIWTHRFTEWLRFALWSWSA